MKLQMYNAVEVRMDDQQVPERFFNGNVAMGTRRQGEQKGRFKNTLKNSLKPLQANSGTWNDSADNKQAKRRAVKTGSAIFKANRIFIAKAKMAAHKSKLP
ncbi:unnamed protein product [Schistocephalus solidus]|uniref:Peptidylprolyl isomerase n=1 Tax=Schistocephalus solidus TaxID=70667 RepID=A0A183SNB4_SCHSO|nr:unnamed protein product [Schistocephalus solidus]